MREDLLGYLLGALDAAERERIERLLDKNPWLREQLELLQSQLEPLERERAEEDDDWELEPPFGLAERTCDFVADAGSARFGEPRHDAPSPRRLSPTPVVVGTSRSYSWLDMAVCAGVFLTTTMLVFPAIAHSRFQSQVAACQNNLRQFAQAIEFHATVDPDRRMPYVPVEGREAFAGFVAVRLNDQTLLQEPTILVCPASDVADRIHQSGSPFTVPTREQLRCAAPASLDALQRSAGGSMGFNVGYVENGRHYAAAYDGRPTFAIAADAPNLHSTDGRTENHGGRGGNVLYADGHVKFVTGSPDQFLRDHPFRNNRGVVEAGIGPDDAVVAPSDTPPRIRFVNSR